MTATTRRLTASLGLVVAAALGFAVALRTPTASADLLPAPPVSTPVTIPSLPSPPAVGGITLPVPGTTTTTLPLPTTTDATTTKPPVPTTIGAPPASRSDATAEGAVAIHEESGPTNSRPGGTTRVAGARRLANGLTSIPVSSVVLPARLVIEQVRLSQPTVTSQAADFTASVRIRDTRGYVVRGARIEIRYGAHAQMRLGAVRTSPLDGRLAWSVHFQKLPATTSKALRLTIRAYKAAGQPVGGVATQTRVAIPIRHRR